MTISGTLLHQFSADTTKNTKSFITNYTSDMGNKNIPDKIKADTRLTGESVPDHVIAHGETVKLLKHLDAKFPQKPNHRN